MIGRQTLEELRSRPRHERRAIATMVAYVSTGLLFVIWVGLFFSRIPSTTSSTTTPQIASSTPLVTQSTTTQYSQY